MIGDQYWVTGIKIKPRGEQWAVEMDFFDNGFCERDATEGTLHLRYLVDDLDRAIEVLIADAVRVGVVFQNAPIGPFVYVENDGEMDDGDHPELRRVANEQAVRLGWEQAYQREAITA